jgi:hypothetical protein
MANQLNFAQTVDLNSRVWLRISVVNVEPKEIKLLCDILIF